MSGGLVTLGETMALVASGPLAQATTASIGMGGAESNVAIGVRRLGGEAAWIGRVGDDSFGTRVLRELRAEGLAVHAAVDPDAPTGLMVKESRRPGASRVWYYRAGSAGSGLCPDDLPRDVVAGARVVHLTGITPGLGDRALDAVRKAIDLAPAATVSFDVNHRPAVWRDREAAPVYRELARAAGVVFAGEDEARLLTGSAATDPHELVDALAATTAGDVVLKRGAAGALAVIDGAVHEVAAVPVAAVDTVGAGDAFVAGYLADLVAGRTARERLLTAVRCGAFACLSAGDWEGLPTRRDLEELDRTDPVVR